MFYSTTFHTNASFRILYVLYCVCDGDIHSFSTFVTKNPHSIPFFRVQEVKELGDLSPRWDGLRRDVIRHCDRLIGSYQETLAELEKLSGANLKIIKEYCIIYSNHRLK